MAHGLHSIHYKTRPDSASPTGLVWADARPSRIGKPAGTLNKVTGYYMTSFQGKSYLCHRILVEHMLGRTLHTWEQVDHIDRDRTNNHPTNLRVVDQYDNQQNREAQANSASMVKGLSYSTRDKTWVGHIKRKGIRYHTSNKDRAVVEQWLIETRASFHKTL